MDINIASEKGSGKINEDSFISTNSTFGVFDGAASLTKWKNDAGKTGGYIASNVVAREFTDPDAQISDIARTANKILRQSMTKSGIDVSLGKNRWSTTIAAVRVNDNTFDWVHIGDSVIIALYRDGSYKLISPYHNHDVEVLALVKSLSGKKIGNLWEYEPFLKASTILQNNRNITYGVLDGSNEALNFINSGTENLDNISNILLLTDGCFIPQENPTGKEDFDTLVKLFKKKGLIGLKDYIRRLQQKDPNLWKYPRFKQSDDYTAIALNFN